MFDESLEALRGIREEPLVEVSTAQLIGVMLATGGLFLVEGISRDGWVPILDSLNLVFHESGHPLFGIFGDTIGFLGGTLMQLIVPLLVAGAGWYKRQTIAIGLSGIWFFQNFLNIARYMADARAQILPLVGGGEHDWATLFGRWGIIQHDTAIAGIVKCSGWAGMIACASWLAWRWNRARHRRG
jgi:hypothetical protein